MWSCPICNREFKIKNQSHSCDSIPIDDHFKGKRPEIINCFRVLKKTISLFEQVHEVSTKSAILYSANSNFLAIKPKNNWLDLEFTLPIPCDEFPIYKVVKASKNLYAHFIRIENVDEIDDQFIKWIKQAYKENIKIE